VFIIALPAFLTIYWGIVGFFEEAETETLLIPEATDSSPQQSVKVTMSTKYGDMTIEMPPETFKDFFRDFDKKDLIIDEPTEGNHQDICTWIRRAAKQGDVEARKELARRCIIGQGIYQGGYFVKVSRSNAEEKIEFRYWIWQAAKLGDAEAQNKLGVMYAQDSNDKEAIKWFKKSAEQGFASAQFNLALMIAKGWGVPVNQKKAIQWFILAAEQGHQKSQAILEKLSVKQTTIAQISQTQLPSVISTPPVIASEAKNLELSEARNPKPQSKIFQDRLKDGSLAPKMVVIPAGSFRMGDIQGGGASDEKAVHTVTVKAFAMSQTEVTFEEYDKYCEATGRKKPNDEGWGRGNRPVINVSWNDAVAYTEWLSGQTGAEYRLPSEAEWEYAARSGSETKYWWGNDIGKNKANCYGDYCGDSYKYASPVGTFEANPFGLYDTVGNVWEWTCSVYESYGNGEEQRCADKNSNKNRVLRGGSWDGVPVFTRSANRDYVSPDVTNLSVGFRLLRTLAH